MYLAKHRQYQEEKRPRVGVKRRRFVERRFKRRRLYALLIAMSIVFAFIYALNIDWFLSNRPQKDASVVMADAKSQMETPTIVPLGKVGGSNLILSVPSSVQNVSGIGYHQSFNKSSLPIKPSINQLDGEPSKGEVRENTRLGRPLAFTMSKRGRGTAQTSSVDITMLEESDVLSPVDGVVVDVVPYKLYGIHDDFRIEIMADDYGWFKIVIAHVKDIAVVKGQRVNTGVTKLARVRSLDMNSQINEYVDGSKEHVHLQVNPL